MHGKQTYDLALVPDGHFRPETAVHIERSEGEVLEGRWQAVREGEGKLRGQSFGEREVEGAEGGRGRRGWLENRQEDRGDGGGGEFAVECERDEVGQVTEEKGEMGEQRGGLEGKRPGEERAR